MIIKNKHYDIIDGVTIRIEIGNYFVIVVMMNIPLVRYYTNIRAPVERQLLEDLYNGL